MLSKAVAMEFKANSHKDSSIRPHTFYLFLANLKWPENCYLYQLLPGKSLLFIFCVFVYFYILCICVFCVFCVFLFFILFCVFFVSIIKMTKTTRIIVLIIMNNELSLTHDRNNKRQCLKRL